MSETIMQRLDDASRVLEQATNKLLAKILSETQSSKRDALEKLGDELFAIEQRLTNEKIRIRRALIRNEPASIDIEAIATLRSSIHAMLLELLPFGIDVNLVEDGDAKPIRIDAAPRQDEADPAAMPAPAPRRMLGKDILEIAKRHVTQRYAHNRVDYTSPNWRGPFDCAEFASYCVWRAYGKLYGARVDGGATSPSGLNVEAYTGYWQEDAASNGKVIDSDAAFAIPGALALRFPPGRGKMGHIAICLGDGRTVYEAHSTRLGVIKGTRYDADGKPRRWNIGILIPGVNYGDGPVDIDQTLVFRDRRPPAPYDVRVEHIQRRLAELGFLSPKGIDGEYGEETEIAVAAFQRAQGLLVDGEVGPDTGGALGLGEIWGRGAPAMEARPAAPQPAPPALDRTLLDETPFVDARTVNKSTKYEVIRQEYIDVFGIAKIKSSWRNKVDSVVDKILDSRTRYEKLASKVGSIPWYAIGTIHNMESTLSFRGHLHNGDPLTSRTKNKPRGRPAHEPANGSTYTWEESALDALRSKGYGQVMDWSLPRMLYLFEAYNGFGPRKNFGKATAYLWSGTDQWVKGKYTSDGNWNPSAPSDQVGCAAVLKGLQEKGAISLP